MISGVLTSVHCALLRRPRRRGLKWGYRVGLGVRGGGGGCGRAHAEGAGRGHVAPALATGDWQFSRLTTGTITHLWS